MDIREQARVRARGAFERAQLRAGVAVVAPIALVVPLAALLHAAAMPAALAPIALALAAALFVAGWRGDGWRRGAPIGLLAGLPGLLLPRLVLAPITRCDTCMPSVMPAGTCFLVCGGAGLVAGAVVGALAARDAHPLRFALSAATIACLTAALTCVVAGMAGISGIAAGIAASSVPTALLRAPSRTRP
jgi:hypothetical protein